MSPVKGICDTLKNYLKEAEGIGEKTITSDIKRLFDAKKLYGRARSSLPVTPPKNVSQDETNVYYRLASG